VGVFFFDYEINNPVSSLSWNIMQFLGSVVHAYLNLKYIIKLKYDCYNLFRPRLLHLSGNNDQRPVRRIIARLVAGIISTKFTDRTHLLYKPTRKLYCD